MPFVNIALLEGKNHSYLKAVSEGIHAAIVETLKRADNDYFQVITEHKLHQWFIDQTYLGVKRSNDCIVVAITMKEGRTPEMKQQLYQRMSNNLSQNPGLRKEDLMVMIHDTPPANWSFGNGVAQLIAA